MPQAGAGARGRQLAMLGSLAHERAVAPALGRLLDLLVGYGASLPYDFDDFSLIRVAHREYQKKIKVPPDHVARAIAEGSASYDGWTRARPANDFATMVPYLERTLRAQPRVFLVLCALQARRRPALTHLSRLSGGMTPFDIRPWGYSYAEARAFLEAIGAEGRAYYASPELILDAFYPPLYAVSRGLALWWLTMPGRIRKAPVPLKVRRTLIAVPILMASLDVVENGCVAVKLWIWPRSVEVSWKCPVSLLR